MRRWTFPLFFFTTRSVIFVRASLSQTDKIFVVLFVESTFAESWNDSRVRILRKTTSKTSVMRIDRNWQEPAFSCNSEHVSRTVGNRQIFSRNVQVSVGRIQVSHLRLLIRNFTFSDVSSARICWVFVKSWSYTVCVTLFFIDKKLPEFRWKPYNRFHLIFPLSLSQTKWIYVSR